MEVVEPIPLAVRVGEREVPAVLWAPAANDAPLVLLGHGGSGHKTSPRQQALAGRLVAAGIAVGAIDGPAHGDRVQGAMAPAEYQAELAARGVQTVAQDMVDDWMAAIDVLRTVGATGRGLGYLGLSMGTRFGLPLAAALGDELTCAVLGKFGVVQSAALNPGLHDPAQLRRDAERVVAPAMWHVQWEDELFPRAGQFELFDSLGSHDKELVAFPGDHRTTPEYAVDEWIAFLVHHLSPEGAG